MAGGPDGSEGCVVEEGGSCGGGAAWVLEEAEEPVPAADSFPTELPLVPVSAVAIQSQSGSGTAAAIPPEPGHERSRSDTGGGVSDWQEVLEERSTAACEWQAPPPQHLPPSPASEPKRQQPASRSREGGLSAALDAARFDGGHAPGDTVRIAGLEQVPHLNGQVGTLLDFDRAARRWRVSFPDHGTGGGG